MASTFINLPSAVISGSAILSDGKIWIGDSSNKAQERTVTGAISLSNTGVTTYTQTVPISMGGTNNSALDVSIGTVFYGDGTSIQSIAAGSLGQVLTSGGAAAPTWQTIAGTGTVTSVGLTDSTTIFNIAGSPVTTSGNINLSFTTFGPNLFLATPDGTSGTPSFRSIVSGDISGLFWLDFLDGSMPTGGPAGHSRMYVETGAIFTGIDPASSYVKAKFSQLVDNGNILFLDPNNRQIYDNTPSTSIDAQSRQLKTSGGTVTFSWGTTYTPSGNTSVINSGSSSNVLYDTTFDGGLGGNAYTIGDIVQILKQLNIFQ